MKRIWLQGASMLVISLTVSLIWFAPPAAAATLPGLALRSSMAPASTARGDDNPFQAAVAGEALSLYGGSLVDAAALSLVLVGLVMSWALFALPKLVDE